MIKNIFKKLLLPALYLFYKDKGDSCLKVLSYHRVTEEQDLNDPLKVSNFNFEKQICYLKQHYHLISGEELVQIINGEVKLPSKSCLITFDDGWEDNYSQALPILKKYNVPAIIFISTDFIGTGKVFWHERLQIILRKITSDVSYDQMQRDLDGWPTKITGDIVTIVKSPKNMRLNLINQLIQDLKKFDPQKLNELNQILNRFLNLESNEKDVMLSWGQVKEMSESNIHFGSHTENHTILTHVNNDKITYELTASKKAIEKFIGKKVYFFSYPNGDYNRPMEKLVQDAGYIAAFAMVTGSSFSLDNLFEIKRYMMREDTCIGLNGKFSELLFKMELDGFRSRLKNKVDNNTMTYKS